MKMALSNWLTCLTVTVHTGTRTDFCLRSTDSRIRFVIEEGYVKQGHGVLCPIYLDKLKKQNH